MISDVLTTFALAAGATVVTWGLMKTTRNHAVTIGVLVDLARLRAKSKRATLKSAYYWAYRNSLPRCIRWIVDRVLGVDATNAGVDNPTRPSDSVRVQSATLRTDELLVELEPYLTKLLEELDVPGGASNVVFSASDLLPSAFVYANEPCTIDVKYRGHSNPEKKIPAKDYFVRYALEAEEVAHFPPYGVRERQLKGFGVKKVRGAVTQGAVPRDVTRLALTCAGPRYNFYADCEDDSVAKNFIDTDEPVLVTYGGGRDNHKMLLRPYGKE